MAPREILMDYFDYSKNNSSLLEILDEGSPDANKRGGYTGVTLNYVWKYILKEQLTKADTLEVLMDLIKEEQIASIFCGNIMNFVFEKYDSDYDHCRDSIEEQIEALVQEYEENNI